ncbi:hypothetical protein F5B22DRAFT_432460 [Xylaria bambusicola]|uniref:uncharacterized protein n=1 Tax=Xylaria bambusicola TaxID=326684 RepID=UPI002007923A|nr:uncharacterized protein F5B22DRAFT_432460 [Xylaria bambusicola]KAI0506838.1 hypothetical protein F5B22DRAFT_432460 [Xylaria bambusicola]
MSIIHFNSEIIKANLSDETHVIQRSWATMADGCLRPNTEFTIPIMCQLLHPATHKASPVASGGVEYDTFETCCPNTNYPAQRNHWALVNRCRLQVCFTDNETLAMEFDECVYKTSTAKLNVTKLADSYRGRCEWIDFDSLKKGVRDVEEIDNSAPAPPRLLSWVLLIVALTSFVLGPSIS